MKKAIAQDFVGEALEGIQPEGNGSSGNSNNLNNAGDGNANDASQVGFTMDAQSGLTVEIVKTGKTETKWISAPFEIIGRVRDPNSEGWARLLRWRDDDDRVHEHTVSDADLHHDVGTLCARLDSSAGDGSLTGGHG